MQTPPERQRLLEGWLPLAQDANTQYGWALDGAALETLILYACQDSMLRLAVTRNHWYPGANILVVCPRITDALPPLRVDYHSRTAGPHPAWLSGLHLPELPASP